jgi:hypothetical protein
MATPPTQLIPSVKFVYSSDILLGWYNKAGTATTIVTGASYPIQLGSFLATPVDAFSQNTKLLYHLNLYQQFRLRRVTKKWRPRFSRADLNAFTSTTINALGVSDPEDYQMQALASYFQTGHVHTWVQDHDDRTMAFTLDEYWQARTNPGAVTFPVTQPYTFSYTPSAFNVVAKPSGVGTGDNPWGPASIQTLVGTPNNTEVTLDASDPMVMPWQATKIIRRPPGGGSGSWDFNLNGNNYLGAKYYSYTPFNTTIGTSTAVQVNVGLFEGEWEFEFRDPDWRPLIAYPTFAPPSFLKVEAEMAVQGLLHDTGMPREADPPQFKTLSQSDLDLQNINVSNANALKRQRVTDSEEQKA